MRAIGIVAGLLAVTSCLVGSAAAKDRDWSGVWTKEGGGSIEVKRDGDRYTVVAGLPADGAERSVSFTGRGRTEELALEGTLGATRGLTGALSGDKEKKGRPCTLAARARDEDGTVVAEAVYTVGGAEVRRETWRRSEPLLEIEKLGSDGKALVGAIDVKSSKTGLEVFYRLRGDEPLSLAVQVVVGAKHPYASFYRSPVVWEGTLGTVEPGRHDFTWNGRDGTPAWRLVLEGDYELVISVAAKPADEKRRAKAAFRVAAPHFEYLTGNSPRGGADGLDPRGIGGDRQARASTKGYTSTRPLEPVTGPELRAGLETAAFAIVSTHGGDGYLQFYVGDPESYDRSKDYVVPTGGVECDMKDLHVAFVSACRSAIPGAGTKSIVAALAAGGCDVAIGVDHKINGPEANLFETLLLSLMERGATVEKAARDSARRAYRARHEKPDLRDEEIDALVAREEGECQSLAGCLVVLRDRSVSESDDFWPPRYGNATR